MPPIEKKEDIIIGGDAIGADVSTFTTTNNTSITLGSTLGTTATYVDGNFNGTFSFDIFDWISSFRISKNVEFKKNSKNLLVLSNNNLVICWDEEKKSFACHDLISFEHTLKEVFNQEKENDFENTNSQNNNRLDYLIYLLLKSDGNYFIDLENNLFYKFSLSNNSWIKLSGCIGKLSFSKNKSISQIKKEKSDRIFICEKIRKKLIFKSVTHLDQGYVYAPYIPLQTTELIYDNTTTLNANNRIYSRYATRTVNNDNYATLTINNNYGQLDHP